MSSLSDAIRGIFDRVIPTKSLSDRYNRLQDPESIAQTIDVGKVHQILESAQDGDCAELFALYRDQVLSHSHIQGEFLKRKLAVLSEQTSVLPIDKKNPDDVRAAAEVKAMIDDCETWFGGCAHLLDACMWPVSSVEKQFSPAPPGSGLRYRLKELIPVPYELFDFRERRLQIFDVDPADGRREVTRHDPLPSRYIVHRGHLLTMPDYWGGPMRALVFWYLFSIMGREWWARLLERYGAPFVVARYPRGQKESKNIIQNALSLASRLYGLVVDEDTRIELIQAGAGQSAESHERFHTICMREISKHIVGQTLSAEAQAQGLGGGVAKFQSDVRKDFQQLDALMLNNTLRHSLFRQYLAINGIPGRPPRVVWGSESYEDAELISKILSNLFTSGWEPDDESAAVISARLGFQIRRVVKPPTAAPAAVPFAAGGPTETDIWRERTQRAHAANDRVIKAVAPDLAAAFRGRYAPLRKIIAEAKSPEDLERRVRAFCAALQPRQETELLHQALTAFAANAAPQKAA
ncbi:MAG TPA: DUF935 family protein [Verrucomicrobiae bacterium]|nr:DUF935 family protein [Verrucomicrobiae bacterium]